MNSPAYLVIFILCYTVITFVAHLFFDNKKENIRSQHAQCVKEC